MTTGARPRPSAPRNYTAVHAAGDAAPSERMARIEARRAFVEIKREFIEVVTQLEDGDTHTEWLRRQVRHAQTIEDLWLLRHPVFAALRRDPVDGARKRHALRRCLDTVFPGTYFQSGFSTL